MFFKKKKRNLIDDLELASKWVAKALNSSNYQADSGDLSPERW